MGWDWSIDPIAGIASHEAFAKHIEKIVRFVSQGHRHSSPNFIPYLNCKTPQVGERSRVEAAFPLMPMAFDLTVIDTI